MHSVTCCGSYARRMPTSSNPFAPRPHRPKEAPNNARLPVARLKLLGVPNVVIAEAERRWAGSSAAEREQARTAFEAQTDDELCEQALEWEFALALEVAGVTEVDEAPLDAMDVLEEAIGVNEGTVENAREWVEGPGGPHPADKALAMLVAERRRGDSEQRKTLLEPLEARVRGADSN